ncbi:hypothetical protein Pcinc_019853 [Petrolisthes cinctipes]|uniref:Uncharacterized protein n=1 Tax=Petrolisthes cinctipes TaxID=88211 RepID=A0AAE1FK70_PETCI|nr:hypothetical protein Pcinc_019853 [Petrolisthes cinctipes]
MEFGCGGDVRWCGERGEAPSPTNMALSLHHHTFLPSPFFPVSLSQAAVCPFSFPCFTMSSSSNERLPRLAAPQEHTDTTRNLVL